MNKRRELNGSTVEENIRYNKSAKPAAKSTAGIAVYKKIAACIIAAAIGSTAIGCGLADSHADQAEIKSEISSVSSIVKETASVSKEEKNESKTNEEKKTVKKEVKVKSESDAKKETEKEEEPAYTPVPGIEIEADDIFYIAYDWEDEDCINRELKQMYNKYAVIKKDDSYNLINFKGELATEVVKEDEHFYEKMYEGLANMDSEAKLNVKKVADNKITTIYKNNVDAYTISFAEPVGTFWDSDSDTVYFKNGKAAVAYSDDASYTGLWCWGENGAEFLNNEVKQGGGAALDEVIPIPQKQTDAAVWGYNDYFPGPYALCKNCEELVTDFIYDECGSCSDGLFAVCQDGKWGYVDENGTEIIPIEFDASWELKTGVRTDDLGEESTGKPYCYAASDGFVNLVKDGQWELRTVTNEVVIEPGEFDRICPVVKGKCWVKKDGKWGVIKINQEAEKLTDTKKAESETASNTSDQTTVNKTEDSNNTSDSASEKQDKKTDSEKKNTENKKTKKQDQFEEILNQYRSILQGKEEYGSMDFPLVDARTINETLTRGATPYYAYCDINSDGVSELAIGVDKGICNMIIANGDDPLALRDLYGSHSTQYGFYEGGLIEMFTVDRNGGDYIEYLRLDKGSKTFSGIKTYEHWSEEKLDVYKVKKVPCKEALMYAPNNLRQKKSKEQVEKLINKVKGNAEVLDRSSWDWKELKY